MVPSRRSNAPTAAVWMILIVSNLFRCTVASPHLSIRGVRHVQEETAAYTKCFETLDSITDGGSALSQSQYVSFLAQIIEGDDSIPSSTTFADLDAVYILIFYMAACEDASNCTPSMSPQSIPLGDITDPSDNLRMLCRVALREGDTKVNATFSYSIQYDTSALDNRKIGECLSTATVNVLLNLLGCDAMNGRQRRRKEQSQTRALTSQDFLELMGESSEGRDLQYGSVISSEEEACPYTLSASVQRITELDMCEEGGADVGIENDAVECGLVQATVSVETNQFVEPSVNALRSRVLDALRDTINDGDYLQFFPSDSGCFVDQ